MFDFSHSQREIFFFSIDASQPSFIPGLCFTSTPDSSAVVAAFVWHFANLECPECATPLWKEGDSTPGSMLSSQEKSLGATVLSWPSLRPLL